MKETKGSLGELRGTSPHKGCTTRKGEEKKDEKILKEIMVENIAD